MSEPAEAWFLAAEAFMRASLATKEDRPSLYDAAHRAYAKAERVDPERAQRGLEMAQKRAAASSRRRKREQSKEPPLPPLDESAARRRPPLAR